jgi:hypothetical protein
LTNNRKITKTFYGKECTVSVRSSLIIFAIIDSSHCDCEFHLWLYDTIGC